MARWPGLLLVVLLGALGLVSWAYTQPREGARSQLRQADAALARGEYGRALWHYQTAAHLMPGSPTPHLRIGELYLRRERPDLAEGEFRQARRQDPRQVKALVGLGRSLSQQDPTEARAALAEALALAPHSAEIHYQIGITYWHQGQFQEAAETSRRAEGEKAEAHWAQAARYRQGLLAVAVEDLPAARVRLTRAVAGPGCKGDASAPGDGRRGRRRCLPRRPAGIRPPAAG